MEKVEEQLAILLSKALEVAEQSGEFVLAQAPLLLQEFYAWHIAKEAVWIFAGLLIYAVARYIMSLLGSKKPFTYTKDKGYSFQKKIESEKIGNRYYGTSDTRIVRTVLHIAGIFTSGLMIILAAYQIVFILVAPRLYLIEYFAGKI